MTKILFISHDASRTGAPMVLLHLLNWLRINKPGIQVDLLVLSGGNLESELKKYAKHYSNYEDCLKKFKINFLYKVLIKLKFISLVNFKKKFIKKISNQNYNLVYANTVVSLPFARKIVDENKNAKLILHVHELQAVIELLALDFENCSKKVDKFITPANIVKENLINSWSLPEQKIELVYECATIKEKSKEINNKILFTIGASGTVDWRKGYDVFIQVARLLCKLQPVNNFEFVWVGKIYPTEEITIKQDLFKLGLIDKVFFIGEVNNPHDYYNNFDVFLMTSREDPFPLVSIEVGLLGKPIISFEKAVGTNEILQDAGGFIVPYLSIEDMAQKALLYYQNPSLCEEHGNLNKIAFSKFTPDIICPQLWNIIEQMK